MNGIPTNKVAEPHTEKGPHHSSTFDIAKLAMIVHELRTPLLAIQGLNSLAEKEDDLCVLAERRARVNDIVTHLLEIVKDILILAKEGAPANVVETSSITVSKLLHEVISVVQPIALTKNVLILKRIDVDFPMEFENDAHRVWQVLVNLLTNAVKFSSEGTTVLLRAKRSAADTRQLCFVVEDKGIGMSEEEVELIFEPFVQLGRTADLHNLGTGLGLPICRNIVEHLGGTIQVKSELGKGSSFTVCLPPTPAGKVLSPKDRPAPRPPHKAIGERRRILVVDDGDLIRDVLRLLLVQAGYLPKAVCTAAQAIAAVQSQTFDLILIDQHLGTESGHKVAEDIRNLPNVDPSLKIIGMSAHFSKDLKDQATRSGMNDFVPKPARMEELTKVVEDGLAAVT